MQGLRFSLRNAKGSSEYAARYGITIYDFVLMLVFSVLFAFVYIGFYHVDPGIGPIRRACLWVARIGVPLVGVITASFYYGVRSGRVRMSSILLFCGSLLFSGAIAYAVLSNLNPERKFEDERKGFHAFLQLSPNDYVQRKSRSATPAVRIFCLGGSTTEFTDGFRSGKKGRGWPVRLEERLRGAISGRDIQVYNCGRTWYTTLHTLINYEANLRQHRPDAIIVMHAVNDLYQNADFCQWSVGPFHEDYRHFAGPLTRLVKRESTWKTILNKVRTVWYYSAPDEIDTEEFPGLRPFERNLRTIIDLAKLDGTEIYLLTQPSLLKETMSPEEYKALLMLHVWAVGSGKKWSLRTATRGMEQYNATVRKVAREPGVHLIDLEKVMPKTLEYLWDEVHYEKKGFDLIADHVAAKIIENGALIDSAGSGG